MHAAREQRRRASQSELVTRERFVVTTRSRLHGLHCLPSMLVATRRVMRELEAGGAAELAASILAGPREFWTVTVWSSRHALQQFMRSGAHGRHLWEVGDLLESFWLARWRPTRHERGRWNGQTLAPPLRAPPPEPALPDEVRQHVLGEMPHLLAAFGPDGAPAHAHAPEVRAQRAQLAGSSAVLLRGPVVSPPGGPGGGGEVGWQPDPTGRFPQRYRMRTGWTRRVRVGGVGSAEAIDEVDVVDAQGADPDGPPGDEDGEAGAEPPGRPWVAASGNGGEWRRDPTGRFDQRWFNGRRLTRRVRHGGAVATDTVSPPRRTGPRWRQRTDAHGDGPGWRPDPDGAGERFHDGHDWTAKWRPAPDGRREQRPGSLRAWLPRTVVRVGVTALAVLAVIAVLVALAVLAGLA